MKRYLLKTSGLAALVLLLHAPGFAQDNNGDDNDTSGDKLRDYDEIVIKHKSDKDAKVTVEIRDNKVFINGKPVSEFNDDNVSVKKKKVPVMDGQAFSFSSPDGEPGVISIAPSPFRNHGGTWSFDGDEWSGSSKRAFLGVTTEKPEKEGEKGARIQQISKGSAAAKAGLKAGDVITRVDEMTIDDPESLSDAIRKYKPEDKATLTLKRDGKEQKMTVTLGKAPMMTAKNFYKVPDMKNFNFDYKMAPRGYGYSYGGAKPRLGIKAQDTEDGKGVKVLEVGDESVAQKAGVEEGDIITRFDGKEVNSATDLAEMARASKDKPNIKVSVIRDGKAQELEVRIPKKLKTADL